MRQDCIFCHLPADSIIAENDLALAFYDKYPVNPGHMLIIPRRHFSSLFEATPEEMLAIYDLLHRVRGMLEERYHPDGYNVGANVGACAGQVIRHLHFHMIPRFNGDVEGPPGGLRRVKKPVTAWERE
ncbi:MAG: HIT family protein [Bacillota bacterium]|nr:HIT family protein [Bacillota bacterium]